MCPSTDQSVLEANIGAILYLKTGSVTYKPMIKPLREWQSLLTFTIEGRDAHSSFKAGVGRKPHKRYTNCTYIHHPLRAMHILLLFITQAGDRAEYSFSPRPNHYHQRNCPLFLNGI